MIYKTDDNRVIMDFRGDILVGCGTPLPENKKSAILIMGGIPDKQPRLIGEYCNDFAGMPSTSLINPIEMVFTNPASIDVIIDALNEAKQLLTNRINCM